MKRVLCGRLDKQIGAVQSPGQSESRRSGDRRLATNVEGNQLASMSPFLYVDGLIHSCPLYFTFTKWSLEYQGIPRNFLGKPRNYKSSLALVRLAVIRQMCHWSFHKYCIPGHLVKPATIPQSTLSILLWNYFPPFTNCFLWLLVVSWFQLSCLPFPLDFAPISHCPLPSIPSFNLPFPP